MNQLLSYFDLEPENQFEVIEAGSFETGIAGAVLEKDVWLTLVLKLLFEMPGAKPMAFKGGTSLSKVYGAIQRFSEDVDVTIDYRSLGKKVMDDLLGMSSRKRDEYGYGLRKQVSDYTDNVIRPYLVDRLAQLRSGQLCEVEVDPDGEKVFVRYPSQAAQGGYLREHVLIEFGGRNIIDPNAIHTVIPDLARHFPAVAFPSATVTVLAAERTFWEKVTLIHAACNRPFRADMNRNSRHWYDLAMLLQHPAGLRAKTDFGLLADVVTLKKVFYRQGAARYDDCLEGGLRLIPDGENMDMLRADYRMMIEAGMMNGHDLTLEEIIAALADLQDEINAALGPAS